MKRLLIPILLGACLQACAGEPAMSKSVTESLRVETPGARVLVHFVADNGTDNPIYVPATVARAQELTRREFEVEADGKPVAYRGKMVKRGPFTAEDFVKVEPHTKVENTIDITDAYAWPAGSHAYTVAYDGSYLTDIAKLDAPTAVTVDRAAFLR